MVWEARGFFDEIHMVHLLCSYIPAFSRVPAQQTQFLSIFWETLVQSAYFLVNKEVQLAQWGLDLRTLIFPVCFLGPWQVQLHLIQWLLCPLSHHTLGYRGESPLKAALSSLPGHLVQLTSPSSSQTESKVESPEGVQSDKRKYYGIGAGSYFLLFWPIVSAVVGEMANSTALIFACNKLSSTPARNFILSWWVLEFNFQWFRICDPPVHLSSWSTKAFAASRHHTERYLAEFHL